MLTAEQLNITQPEYDALLIVRNNLEDGTFFEASETERTHHPSRMIFDMDLTAKVNECGSAGCIGGWMGAVMFGGGADQLDAASMDRALEQTRNFMRRTSGQAHSDALLPLFYPEHCDYLEGSKLTTNDAIEAIDSFLETGAPDWPAYVSEEEEDDDE